MSTSRSQQEAERRAKAFERMHKHEMQPFRKGGRAEVKLNAVMLGRHIWLEGTIVDTVPNDISAGFLAVDVPGLGTVHAYRRCGACKLCLLGVDGREATQRELADAGCTTVRCGSCVVKSEWQTRYRNDSRPDETEDDFTARLVDELHVIRL